MRQANPSGSSLVELLRAIGGDCCHALQDGRATPWQVGRSSWPPELLTPKRERRETGEPLFMNPEELSPVGWRPGIACTEVTDDFLRAPCAVREG